MFTGLASLRDLLADTDLEEEQWKPTSTS
jgi:hypothetical protein